MQAQQPTDKALNAPTTPAHADATTQREELASRAAGAATGAAAGAVIAGPVGAIAGGLVGQAMGAVVADAASGEQTGDVVVVQSPGDEAAALSEGVKEEKLS